jgi:hypothetical protein
VSLQESPETFLYARLIANATVASYVASRIYPVLAPMGTAMPLVVYQRTGVSREPALNGPTGSPIISVQLTTYGTSYIDLKQIARAIRLSVDGYVGTYGNVTIQRTNLTSEVDGAEMPTDDQMLPYYYVQQTFEFRVAEAV